MRLKLVATIVTLCVASLGIVTSAWATEVTQNISGDLKLVSTLFAKCGGYHEVDKDGVIQRVSMGNYLNLEIHSLQDPQGVVKDVREFDLIPTIDGVEYPQIIRVAKNGSDISMVCPYTVYGKFNLKAIYKKDPQKVYNFSFKIVQDSMVGIRSFFHFEDEDNDSVNITPKYRYDRISNTYVLTLPQGIAPKEKNTSFKGWKIDNKIYQPGDSVVVPADGSCGAIKTVQAVVTSRGSWKLYSNGLWAYYYDNARYAKDDFKIINNKTYHFDKSGWMDTGWVFDKGNWYLMAQSGEMLYGWQKVKGLWYYLDKETGKMAANTTIDGYKVSSFGVWVA